jgi:iron complex outermembrane receptor protein
MKRSLLWLAVGAGSVFIPKIEAAVMAQDDPARAALRDQARLETILVSAPLHKSSAETALPVTVIDSDELRERAAASLGATLDGSPGVASASFGPGVGQPVVRGQSGPRVRVLQNGTASADASAVSADHAVTVEALLAESVEILRGPATLLYGGGAIGGVVNVIDNRIPTKAVEKPLQGAFEQRHDSASDGDASVLTLEGGDDRLAWHLDGVYREWNDIDIPALAFNRRAVEDVDESSDGFILNSGGRNRSLTAGASWLFDDGYLGFAVADMRNDYGVPAGGHAHHEDETEAEHAEHAEEGIRIDMQQRRYDLKGERRELGAVIDTLRAHLSYSDYEHKEIEGSGEVGTVFTNQTWESRIEAVHREFGGWHGVFGLQLKHADFAAVGAESFIPEAVTRNVGLFLVEDYHAGDWLYEFGLRFDRDRVSPRGAELDDATFNSPSLSASALWRFSPDWRAGVALSQSRRAPAVEELFSNAGNVPADLVAHGATQAIEIGDADLDSEQSRNIDLTLNYDDGAVRGQFAVFYNRFADYIYLHNTGVELDELPVLQYAQQDAEFHGAEFEVTLPLGDALSLDLHGDAVRGELDNGDDVPRLPPWRVGARIDYQLGGFAAYAGVMHAADQKRSGAFEAATRGYDRVDAGVSYTLPVAQTEALLFLRGTNLTDRTIRASTSFLRDFAPEPGRSLEAGVRLRF